MTGSRDDFGWDDLLASPADPQDVERALRSGIGQELPPRRQRAEPQLEGSSPQDLAEMRRALGLQ